MALRIHLTNNGAAEREPRSHGKCKTTPPGCRVGVSIGGVDWGRGVDKLVIGYLSSSKISSYIFNISIS